MSPPGLGKLTSKIATSSIECGFWCFKSNLGLWTESKDPFPVASMSHPRLGLSEVPVPVTKRAQEAEEVPPRFMPQVSDMMAESFIYFRM